MQKHLAVAVLLLLAFSSFSFAEDSNTTTPTSLLRNNTRLTNENAGLQLLVEQKEFYRQLYASDKAELAAALDSSSSTLTKIQSTNEKLASDLQGATRNFDFKLESIKIFFIVSALFSALIGGLVSFWVMSRYRSSERMVESIRKNEKIGETESGQKVI